MRADLVGDLDPATLRATFPDGLLYSLRSVAEGGHGPDDAAERRRRLLAAADQYDLLELEARDLHPDILERVPPQRRVLSWHGPACDSTVLRRRLAGLTAVQARLYRLVPHATTAAQALAPLHLLQALRRRDVTAYASGPAGTWTRVLAAWYGAPVAFGAASAAALPDGTLPARRLARDFPHSLLSQARWLHAVIGGSVAHSLLPLMHNTAYRTLELPALFLPIAVGELGGCLPELVAGLDRLGLPLCGATVLAPFKEAAFALATEASVQAHDAGAASLLLHRAGAGWWADNEATGVVSVLTEHGITLAGRQVAVVGCGGAGRAAAVGLSHAGARVTLVNRGAEPGLRAAAQLGLPFQPLRNFDPRPFEVLVSATPMLDPVPFPLDSLARPAVVLDLAYGPEDSPLITAARAAGHLTFDGGDMLLAEVPRRFRLMTGRGTCPWTKSVPPWPRTAGTEVPTGLLPAATSDMPITGRAHEHRRTPAPDRAGHRGRRTAARPRPGRGRVDQH